MNEPPRDGRRHGARPLADQVRAKAKRKLAARRNASTNVWFGLGMIGVVGWSVTIPVLLGVALGAWIDTHYPGKHSWTLALLCAGLVLGVVSAWHWVAKEGRALDLDHDRDHDDD